MYSGNLDSSMGFFGRSAADALLVQAFRNRSVFNSESCNFLKRVTVGPDDRRFVNMLRPFLGTLPIALAELPGWSAPDSTLYGRVSDQGWDQGTPALAAGDLDRSWSWVSWLFDVWVENGASFALKNILWRLFQSSCGFSCSWEQLSYLCFKIPFNFYLFILFCIFNFFLSTVDSFKN